MHPAEWSGAGFRQDQQEGGPHAEAQGADGSVQNSKQDGSVPSQIRGAQVDARSHVLVHATSARAA